MLQIVYSRDAAKALRKIPGKQKLRILNAIEKVAENPARSDLDIEDVGPRGSIY